jgi:hypothetical protein
MPHLLLDNFDVPGVWIARDPANNPSAEIVVTADLQTHPFARDPSAIRVDIHAGATGHALRRVLAATDLSSHDDLTLWYRSDVAATAAPTDPVRLRLALGSAALPIGAVGNDWLRYLRTERAGVWAYGVFDLDDLPNAVRTALTTIELQVVATDGAHTIILDALEALTPRMVADTDAALLTRLDAQLALGGSPVPVVIAPDTAPPPLLPPPPNRPSIRLVQYEATRNARRDHTGLRRTDFTETGHRLRPSPIPWDLFYRVEFISNNRSDQSAMLDFVIDRLGHREWLPVGNRAIRIEQVDQVTPDDALVDAPTLRYRVSAWEERGLSTPVLSVGGVRVNTDIKTPGTANGGA